MACVASSAEPRGGPGGLQAPLTVGLTVLATRVVPPRARTRVTVALIVIATVTVSAIPVLGRFGARPDNPTILPRDYVGGWLVLVALVVVVTLLAGPVAGLVRRRRGRGVNRPAG